jgi:hypothetical protein
VLHRKTSSKLLLAILIGYMFFAPLIDAAPGLPIGPIIATVLMLGLLAGISYARGLLLIGVALAVPAIALDWLARHDGGVGVRIAARTFSTATLCYVAYLTIRHLWHQKRVDGEMLREAVVVYLLIGAAFVGLYAVVLNINPDAIRGIAAENIDERLSELTYFSFVTMTTLGYGDIVPQSEFARSLAMFQALAGQAYIAFVIAKLVAIYTVTHDPDDR